MRYIITGWIPLILSILSQGFCVWIFIEFHLKPLFWQPYQYIGFAIAWCVAYVFSIIGWFQIFDRIFK